MKNFLIAFLVFLIWSFFGLWLYSWLQPSTTSEENTTAAITEITEDSTASINEPLQVDEPVRLNENEADSLSLVENEDEVENQVELPSGLKASTSNGDLVFLYTEGISIEKNSPEIIIDPKLLDFKYKLNTYLIEHPNEELHIGSLYSASENIESPNLGFQRAKKIEKILLETGIRPEKIVIKPIIREIDFDPMGNFPNGISFSFHPLDNERIEARKLALPETTTLYPKIVNNEIFVSPALEELLEKVKDAVSANPDLQIEVIGHTDNVGNANDNYILGLKHARQVRWYLVTKGKISRKKIKAISKGESESIASNKTARGRLLNRRIEIKYYTN
ncbi:MAG: OmpA family protein [Flavobacteriaceae bacterium]|nr:OmpA family protein [Flavobacteriaceae bacterium]